MTDIQGQTKKKRGKGLSKTYSRYLLQETKGADDPRFTYKLVSGKLTVIKLYMETL